MKIYTSYYAKMLKRHKGDFDCYIQVSSNLGKQALVRNVDDVAMKDLIDVNLGTDCFGNYWGLDDYKNNLVDDALDAANDIFKDLRKAEGESLATGELKQGQEAAVFLLCFENLDAKYTKKDKEKYPDDPHVIVGAHKLCHRTLLAEVLNERYNLGITEYKGD